VEHPFLDENDRDENEEREGTRCVARQVEREGCLPENQDADADQGQGGDGRGEGFGASMSRRMVEVGGLGGLLQGVEGDA